MIHVTAFSAGGFSPWGIHPLGRHQCPQNNPCLKRFETSPELTEYFRATQARPRGSTMALGWAPVSPRLIRSLPEVNCTVRWVLCTSRTEQQPDLTSQVCYCSEILFWVTPDYKNVIPMHSVSSHCRVHFFSMKNKQRAFRLHSSEWNSTGSIFLWSFCFGFFVWIL